MGDPVVHFEIVGKDAQALRKFYHEAFDWAIDPPAQGAGIPDYSIVHPAKSGAGIDGGIGTSPEGYSGHVTVYVGVENAAEALKKIETLGGKTMMGPEQVPDGPILGLFEDPEGHVVGVVQI